MALRTRHRVAGVALLLAVSCQEPGAPRAPDVAGRQAAVETSPLQVTLVADSLTAGAGTPAYVSVTYPEGWNGVKARIHLAGAATAVNYPQPPYASSRLGACSESMFSSDGYGCNPVAAGTIECIATYLPGEDSHIPLCLSASSPGSFTITVTAEPYWIEGPPASTTLTGEAVAAAVADVRLTKMELFDSGGTFVGLPNGVSFQLANLGPRIAADTTVRLRVTRGSASFPDEESRLPMGSVQWGGFWNGWCRRDADGLGVTCPLGGVHPFWMKLPFGDIDFVPLAAGPLELTLSVSSSTADRAADDNQRVLVLDAVAVPTYDLAIASVQTSKKVAGRPMTQRITLENNGPDLALGPHNLNLGVYHWGPFSGSATVFPVTALRVISAPPGSSCLLQREFFLADCTIGALASGETAVVEVESLPPVADAYLLFAFLSTAEFHIDPEPANNAVFDVFEVTKGRKVLKQDLEYTIGDFTDATCAGVTSPLSWNVAARLTRRATRNDNRASVRDRTVEITFGAASLEDGSEGGFGRSFELVRGHVTLGSTHDLKGGLVTEDEKVHLDFAETSPPPGSVGLLLQVQARVKLITDANGAQGYRVYRSETRCRQGRTP